MGMELRMCISTLIITQNLACASNGNIALDGLTSKTDGTPDDRSVLGTDSLTG